MRIVLLITCLNLPFVASADVFKWKDASGHVHYSDQPISDKAKSIRSAPAQAEQAVASLRDLADKDLEFKKRQEDAAKAKEKTDKEAAAARLKQENCERARKNLAAMDQNRRIYTTDAYGQRNYMNEQERADNRARYEKTLAENCR